MKKPFSLLVFALFVVALPLSAQDTPPVAEELLEAPVVEEEEATAPAEELPVAEETPQTPPPVLEILLPSEGYVAEVGEEVTFRFGAENFLFVDFAGNREPFPGNSNAGHAHLWIDDPNGTHDDTRQLLSAGAISLGALPKGEHTVTVELTQNHHVSYAPPVRATTTFYVGQPPVITLSGSGSPFLPFGLFLVVLLVAFIVMQRKGMLPMKPKGGGGDTESS